MREHMSIFRYQQPPVTLHKTRGHPLFITYVFFVLTLSATAADLRGVNTPQISLLKEFRPIGGSGNNLENPDFDVVPGSPEIALAPLNFAPGTRDGLVNGPNPRTISNVISGGTGANGQNGQTTDPVASAWLYVFGQFVDHDLGLEDTPLTSAAINIPVPPGDPVFLSGTTILMTRDTRNPDTNIRGKFSGSATGRLYFGP